MIRSAVTWKRTGMTLIEIMIVVVLMASLMALGAMSLGLIGNADVHGDALKLSSSIRYTFNMAATSNMTLQMKLDFDAREYSVEKLDLAGGLSEDELRGTTMKSSTSGDEDRWRDRSRADKMDVEDTRFGTVTRTPIDDDFLAKTETTLSNGVYFLGIITSHHDEIQTEGVGTMNFFSNGFVERSVIYLGDEQALQGEEDGIVYSIIVNPLTGQSSVSYGRKEVSSTFFEEEEDR